MYGNVTTSRSGSTGRVSGISTFSSLASSSVLPRSFFFSSATGMGTQTFP